MWNKLKLLPRHGRQVFFVHGYNNTPAEAEERRLVMYVVLRAIAGASLKSLSWNSFAAATRDPSLMPLPRIMGHALPSFMYYGLDRLQTMKAEVIEKVGQQIPPASTFGAGEISVISHSRGSDLITRWLLKNQDYWPKIERVAFVHPDLALGTLINLVEKGQFPADKIGVFDSENDFATSFSSAVVQQRVRDFHQQFLRNPNFNRCPLRFLTDVVITKPNQSGQDSLLELAARQEKFVQLLREEARGPEGSRTIGPWVRARGGLHCEINATQSLFAQLKDAFDKEREIPPSLSHSAWLELPYFAYVAGWLVGRLVFEQPAAAVVSFGRAGYEGRPAWDPVRNRSRMQPIDFPLTYLDEVAANLPVVPIA